jgi:hypothetical protein
MVSIVLLYKLMSIKSAYSGLFLSLTDTSSRRRLRDALMLDDEFVVDYIMHTFTAFYYKIPGSCEDRNVQGLLSND